MKKLLSLLLTIVLMFSVAAMPFESYAAALKSTSITSVTAKNNSITVKWKIQKKVTGYQVQYSTSKKFKKNKKTVTVKKAKSKVKTIKSLKAKKTYYVRVRTYKTSGKKKKYSKWSKVKSIKTKNAAASKPVKKNVKTLSAPKLVSVSKTNEVGVKVTWNSVPNAERYVIHYAKKSDFSSYYTSKGIVDNGGKSYSFSISGLNQVSTYYFRVVACCNNVESKPSNILSLKTGRLASNTTMTKWQTYAPEDDGTINIDEYVKWLYGVMYYVKKGTHSNTDDVKFSAGLELHGGDSSKFVDYIKGRKTPTTKIKNMYHVGMYGCYSKNVNKYSKEFDIDYNIDGERVDGLPFRYYDDNGNLTFETTGSISPETFTITVKDNATLDYYVAYTDYRNLNAAEIVDVIPSAKTVGTYTSVDGGDVFVEKIEKGCSVKTFQYRNQRCGYVRPSSENYILCGYEKQTGKLKCISYMTGVYEDLWANLNNKFIRY